MLIQKEILITKLGVALLLAQGVASADFIQLTDPSQLSSAGFTATYTQPDSTSLPNPFPVSTGPYTITFSTVQSDGFQKLTQSQSFFGNFAPQTPLLDKTGANTELIQFSDPLGIFGLEAQHDVVGTHSFTATLLTRSGSDLVPRYSFDVFEDFNQTAFLGALATGTDRFDAVSITSDDNNGIAVGPIRFQPKVAEVPEPASVFLMLAAASTVGIRLLRRNVAALFS